MSEQNSEADSFEKRLHEYYPSFPNVDLGSNFSDPELSVTLPSATDTKKLVELVQRGRKLQQIIEGDIGQAYKGLVEHFGFPAKPAPQKHQQSDLPAPLADGWSVSDSSTTLDNRGFVHRGEDNKTRSETGRIVDRSFDYLFSVLESLPVGAASPLKYWQTPRTVNPIVYPHGPNLRIKFVQNKEYNVGTKDNPLMLAVCHATGAVYENIFNFYDGVIIMTEYQPPKVDIAQDGTKVSGPPCATWSDVTFQQWNTLHMASRSMSGTPRVHLDTQFPFFNGRADSFVKNHEYLSSCVAGRLPSKHRAPFDFYLNVGPNERRKMKGFLNYIISYGNSISDKTLSVILRCLDSRDPFGTLKGKAPAWGSHESFGVGEWAFYALLATDIGQEIAMFLGRHKRDEDLGHLIIKSCTIFAADSNMSVDALLPPLLVKYPVLIFEVVPFKEEYVDQARKRDGEFLDGKGVHKPGPDGEPWFPLTTAYQLAHDSPNDMPRICLPDAELYLSNQTPGNMVLI